MIIVRVEFVFFIKGCHGTYMYIKGELCRKNTCLSLVGIQSFANDRVNIQT